MELMEKLYTLFSLEAAVAVAVRTAVAVELAEW
jgi:hypothetical protein